MAEKKPMQNIIAIDLLRALAALGVFTYHMHLGALLAKYSGIHLIAYMDALGAFYAVPLFFLISGYCIHASNIKYIKANVALPLKEYYLRRFLRIYPPYLFALLFALGINYIASGTYKPSLTDFIVHLFSLQGFTVPYFNSINVVLWTISVELAFYAIYPLFYYVRFKYNLNYALLLTLIVSCISIAYFQINGSINIAQRFCVFNLWFAWCCGAFLADKKMLNHGDLKQPVYLVLYFVVLVIFAGLKYFPNGLFIISDQFSILLWAAPMMFIISKEDWLRQHKNTWVIRIGAAIGLSSYSLYLLHEPLIYLKNFAAHKYLPASLQFPGLILGIFIIPVITWYSFQFIEKPFISRKKPIEQTA